MPPGAVGDMRAARLRASGQLVCETVPRPSIGDEPDQVLVRTELAAICGSDLHVVHHGLSAHDLPGPAGYPGHESVGEVVRSNHAAFRVGQRVLTIPPPTDARCFADYQQLPADQILRVPDSLTAEHAVLAQQLGTVLFALKRFWPASGASAVTIIGAGSAGLLMVQEVRRRGVDLVIVSDREPVRRERAVELGADVVVDADVQTAAQATLEATDGRGAGLVIEAAGTDAARADAVGAVSLCGTVGCFGLPESPGFAPMPFELLFRRRATLHVEHGAQEERARASFCAALEQIEHATTDVSGMLTHRFALDRIDEALVVARDRRDGAIKVAVDMA